MSDLSLRGLERALDGVSARQRVHADNIANVETPRVLAGRVDFEDSLRRAMLVGRPELATDEVTRSNAPVNVNGNNVNLDEETMALVQDGLRYQLLVESVNAKFDVLRAAIGRGT